jgi:poly(3-hydroxybutyrate) depolymerase
MPATTQTGTGGSASHGSGGSNAAPSMGSGGSNAVPGTGGSAPSTPHDAGNASPGSDAGTQAGPSATDSAAALDDLKTYLASSHPDRNAILTQPFASVLLTKQDAAAAKTALWDDYAAYVHDTRASEVGATETQAVSVSVDGHMMRYYMAVRGDEPPTGRSLFISMHGGGNTTTAMNDSQWENQISLVDGYMPVDALWVAPRAPSDDWNMWFTPDIDPLFERLISDLIVFEGIDPNKVYINGYSAGGDGVYQLGPRMADCWAGAAMSAGHPNDASPLSLRDVPFAIHVGGDDTAYDRNLKAAEWGMMLEMLAAADPGGYINQWQVHDGLPHWMNLEDKVAIPFVQMYSRDPVPAKVVWRQSDVIHARFYWLAVDPMTVMKGATIRAEYADGAVKLSEVMDLKHITVRFSDAMLDLDQPVHVEQDGNELFAGTVSRTIEVMARTLEERGDPELVFSGEVGVDLQ